eukprot:7288539-Karenia_brevis.AAC.1
MSVDHDTTSSSLSGGLHDGLMEQRKALEEFLSAPSFLRETKLKEYRRIKQKRRRQRAADRLKELKQDTLR